jgi:SAM-dependent methyltransferase
LKMDKSNLRRLEIGCGDRRIEGFETLNIISGSDVDYVCDASKPLPFNDNTFDIIYSSHILEHIPWYQTEVTLKEWVRILKSGGTLEIWVPDGLKICQTLITAELGVANLIENDGWYKFNPRKDPCVWASGRIFTYGDGTGKPDHPNWHRALFTARYLKELFELVGLINIKEMDHSEVRGYDHGWINLGMKGIKA